MLTWQLTQRASTHHLFPQQHPRKAGLGLASASRYLDSLPHRAWASARERLHSGWRLPCFLVKAFSMACPRLWKGPWTRALGKCSSSIICYKPLSSSMKLDVSIPISQMNKLRLRAVTQSVTRRSGAQVCLTPKPTLSTIIIIASFIQTKVDIMA